MGFLSHVRNLNTLLAVRQCQVVARQSLPKARPFSSTSHLLASRLGLGGNNWSRMDPAQYQNVVQTSLDQDITLMEAGQEGGDKALLDALKAQEQAKPVTVTLRIGYHTIVPPQEDEPRLEPFPGDVTVEQHPFLGPDRTMTPKEEDAPTPAQEEEEDTNQMIQILHNISGVYIQTELKESPLVQEFQTNPDNMRVIALLHNPESQLMAQEDIHSVSIEERQTFLRDRLVDAFVALEQAVSNKSISGYGVVSNGLCLPTEHPLALNAHTILEASKLAMEQSNSTKSHLSAIQLPINLMERTGLDIANNIHTKIETEDEYQHLRDSLKIYAMRPLTCYPDRGSGTGHAFKLVDYLLPSAKAGDEDKEITDEELASKQWSNQMQGPPLIYSIALKKAMGHFDAEFLLEEKHKRELTGEERETLDGCKLLQSMLHDLDQGLEEVRSLGMHENDLYQRIIPLIHDTFEEYDEDTADVLQTFFKSYSLAVRYSIANNTRALLQQGGDDGKGFKYEDIPHDEKLQDYALKYLLKEKAIDHVILGATQPDHIVQMAKVWQRVDPSEEKTTE